MLLRIFSSYKPLTLVLIFLIAAAIWVIPIPKNVISSDHFIISPIYQSLFSWLTYKPGLSSLLSFIIIFLLALSIVRLNDLHSFLPDRSYLPAFTYFIIAGSFPELKMINPMTISLILIFWAMARVIFAFRSESLSYRFFDASFLIGLASLFYFPSVIYILVLWLILIFLRPFHWREWFYSISGIAILILFVFTFYFLFDRHIDELKNYVSAHFKTRQALSMSVWDIINYVFIAFIVIVSSIQMIRLLTSTKSQIRKTHMQWFFMFLGTISMLLIPATGFELLMLVAVPISYLLSMFFLHHKRGWMGNVLYLLIILLFVIARIF